MSSSRARSNIIYMLILFFSSIFLGAKPTAIDRERQNQMAVLLSRIDSRYLNERMTPEQWRDVLEQALTQQRPIANDGDGPSDGEAIPIVINAPVVESPDDGGES